tara:strand:+ start:11542 stop:12789 length:1248 start_codon:yes stop_codon:yes gene_type:complete
VAKAKTPFTVHMQPGGLTDAKGFLCSSIASDIRGVGSDCLDLGMVYSALPCSAGAVFTQNKIVAAPVRLCQERLKSQNAFHGIVFNSGNANACTGPQGEVDALAMAKTSEYLTEAPEGSFFVASTGRIGRTLPIKRILKALKPEMQHLGSTKVIGLGAADCILTSDTKRKVVTVKVKTSQGSYTISGIAKGAGMIQPNMATMLAFITTDAKVPARALQRLVQEGVGPSFNSITVDGDTSTNDAVIALANGASGVKIGPKEKADFVAGFNYVCEVLARLIVGDGEKITKVVELRISGARSAADADKVARTIGNSLLVKTSWFGQDPNWGRLFDAAGYAGVDLVEAKLNLAYRVSDSEKAVPVFAKGLPVSKNELKWKKVVREKEFIIEMDMGLGRGSARLFASDLTDGYVNFNRSE